MKKSLCNHWMIVFALFSFLLLCCNGEEVSPIIDDGDPVVTETGVPNGDVSTASIGTSGGVLNSVDGNLTLTIPSGALSATTSISIQSISNEAPLGLGNGYRLLPEGVHFAKPVQLSFHYNDQVLQESSDDFLWIVTQADDGSWNAMLKSVTNTTNKTVTIETSHFSDWSLGRFINMSLTPSSKTILKGQAVTLQITGFAKQSSVDDDELAPLVPITSTGDGLTPLTPIPPVESRLMEFKVKRWTMNGATAPVSNSNGSLQLSDNAATYTAPDKKPSTNPVAVTVELESNNKEGSKSSYMLTANITVIDDLYLLVTIDGQEYEYYQYGYNGRVAPDPNNIAVANCGIYDEKGLVLGGSIIQNSSTMVHGFALQFSQPVEGTNTFTCYLDDGTDDMAFGIGDGGEGYELSYSKRTPNNDICDLEQLCGEATLTLTEFRNEAESIVSGSFSGTLYENKPGLSDACQSSIPHPIKGEFWLKRVN